MKRTEKYYIGNRQYVTGESDLLCETGKDPLTGMEGGPLYRTKKACSLWSVVMVAAGQRLI